MIQLKDTTEMRVPFWRGSKVTPFIDNAVKRDLGDISRAQFAAKANLRGINIGFGYELSYKQSDVYTGQQYNPEWYEYIGKDTLQRMQAATVTVGYDTLTLFKEKKFPAPLSILFTHSRLVEGKNVNRDPFTTIDVNLYF